MNIALFLFKRPRRGEKFSLSFLSFISKLLDGKVLMGKLLTHAASTQQMGPEPTFDGKCGPKTHEDPWGTEWPFRCLDYL